MCSKCDWEEYKDKMEEMSNDSDYDFASDTIENIFDWVEENEHITEGQKTAIDNIEGSI